MKISTAILNEPPKDMVDPSDLLSKLARTGADQAVAELAEVLPELAGRLQRGLELFRNLDLTEEFSAHHAGMARQQYELSVARLCVMAQEFAKGSVDASTLMQFRSAAVSNLVPGVSEMTDDILQMRKVEVPSAEWYRFFEAQQSVIELGQVFLNLRKSFVPASLDDLKGCVAIYLEGGRTAFVVHSAEAGEEALIFGQSGELVETVAPRALLARERILRVEEGRCVSPIQSEVELLPCLYRDSAYFEPGDRLYDNFQGVATVVAVDAGSETVWCMSDIEQNEAPVRPDRLEGTRRYFAASKHLLFPKETLEATTPLLRASSTGQPRGEDAASKLREAWRIADMLTKNTFFELLASDGTNSRMTVPSPQCLRNFHPTSDLVLSNIELLDRLPIEIFTPELLEHLLESSSSEGPEFEVDQSLVQDFSLAHTLFFSARPDAVVEEAIRHLGDAVQTAPGSTVGMEYSGNELARYTRQNGARTVCIYADSPANGEKCLAAVAIYRCEESSDDALMRMAVHPDFQRTGLSKRLLFAVMADLHAEEVTTYSGTQRLQNKAAMKFQHRWGATLSPFLELSRIHPNGSPFHKIKIHMPVNPKLRARMEVQPQREEFLAMVAALERDCELRTRRIGLFLGSDEMFAA